MNRVCLAVCCCVPILAACADISKPVFPRHYTLAATAPPAHQGRLEAQTRKTLRIARITVPPWLQGTDLYYRLEYLHDARIYAYGRSDWVAPPGILLEHVVQETITADKFWRAVIGPSSAATADNTLQIRIDDFSQTFASPDQSFGVLDAMATLIDQQTEMVISQKHFRIQAEATSADAAGGVDALNRAGLEFAAQLQQWLQMSVEGSAPRKRSAPPR